MKNKGEPLYMKSVVICFANSSYTYHSFFIGLIIFTLYYRCLFLLAFVNPLNTAIAENTTTSSQTEYLTQVEFPPPALIENLNWISGHWQYEIWGGQFEEI
jgi:hypothetical protein